MFAIFFNRVAFSTSASSILSTAQDRHRGQMCIFLALFRDLISCVIFTCFVFRSNDAARAVNNPLFSNPLQK